MRTFVQLFFISLRVVIHLFMLYPQSNAHTFRFDFSKGNGSNTTNKKDCHTKWNEKPNSYVASWFPVAVDARSHQISAGKINIFIYYDVDTVWPNEKCSFVHSLAGDMVSLWNQFSKYFQLEFRHFSLRIQQRNGRSKLFGACKMKFPHEKYIEFLFMRTFYARTQSRMKIIGLILDVNRLIRIELFELLIIPNRCDYSVQLILNRWSKYRLSPVEFPCYRSAFQF